ncbi:hypothetical protein JR316_0010317 [Psilocybe cubensis]|uniref:Uncharacterized protein n=2 Tax=Psilocybe cubensis TaxID=181762 RepID=A0ACB8GRH6_PSICU|nr:hypothetical protein JR316_0010317 [Psilocybe cubensis]KAH9478080.1 hypothetical protein JR316_0010317 [Psilocybe cubensis]
MYPPTGNTGRYQRLSQDPERILDPHTSSSSKSLLFRIHLRDVLRDLWRIRYARFMGFLTAVLLIGALGKIYMTDSPITDVFAFDQNEKPLYLNTHPQTPLALRLTIMSRVEEFERRETLRQTMLNGVFSKDVHLDYKFVVGRAVGLMARARIFFERLSHDDMLILEDLNDVANRLSEKRYAALQWANIIPHDEYDFSMTVDSDTFCRLGALARRLRHEYPDIKPRNESIIIARMLSNLVYFENTVPDGNTDDDDEDHYVKGPWYSHPIGFAYLISSNTTRTILSANPPLPHHVNYPGDDVMIGSWIAGFKHMNDPSTVFETVPENTPPPQYRVYPKPYIPYTMDTKVVDDEAGFHDVKGRGGKDARVGWQSVCVHRLTSEEMRLLREREEIESEWESPIR